MQMCLFYPFYTPYFMCLNGNHYTPPVTTKVSYDKIPKHRLISSYFGWRGSAYITSPQYIPARDSLLWRMPKCFYSIRFTLSILMMNFNVSLFHFSRLWTPKWMRNVEVFHSCSETIVSHFDEWQAHWNCWLGPSNSLWIAQLDLNHHIRAQLKFVENIVFGGKFTVVAF